MSPLAIVAGVGPGAVGAQSAGLEPFDFPLLPHDVVLALFAVHPEGDCGPGRRWGRR